MEFITYDAQTCRNHCGAESEIRFNRSGIITISKKACDCLGLDEGDMVKLHQDKKKKQDWYLEKVTMGGLKLKKNHKAGSVALTLQSSLICKEVLLSLGKDKPVKCPIAASPIEGKYYALLTSSLK
jgi:hypothetical protein